MYSITIEGRKFNLLSPTQKELDRVPENDLKEIGNRIKNLRKIKNIKQADIAKDLFMTSQAYGNIEAGKVKRLTVQAMEIICSTLDTTYNYLLGYTSDPACGKTNKYCLQNREQKDQFIQEIDEYVENITITQLDKVIFDENMCSDRIAIAKYILSCTGDVVILTGGKHILIDDKTANIYLKIRNLHGDISILNNKEIKVFKNIDSVRDKLINCLSSLKDFAVMTVYKSNYPKELVSPNLSYYEESRKIEYTVFVDNDSLHLRDERDLKPMIAEDEFQVTENDKEQFSEALNKIIYNQEYYSADGLFILDKFIRAMDVPMDKREELKKEISRIIDKYVIY